MPYPWNAIEDLAPAGRMRDNLQHVGRTGISSDYVFRDSAPLGLRLTVVLALLYGF
jgi:hypothetical protein